MTCQIHGLLFHQTWSVNYLLQDFSPLALTSVQWIVINSSHLAVRRAPYWVHFRYLKFRAPLSWTVVGI